MSLPDYRKDKNISPCPRCNGEVEWTNSRDLNVLTSYMLCSDCDLNTFSVETVLFTKIPELPNKDYESTLMKYNSWCCTNPDSYCEEVWGQVDKKGILGDVLVEISTLDQENGLYNEG